MQHKLKMVMMMICQQQVVSLLMFNRHLLLMIACRHWVLLQFMWMMAFWEQIVHQNQVVLMCHFCRQKFLQPVQNKSKIQQFFFQRVDWTETHLYMSKVRGAKRENVVGSNNILGKFPKHLVLHSMLILEFEVFHGQHFRLLMLVEDCASHVIRTCILSVAHFLHKIESPIAGFFGVAFDKEQEVDMLEAFVEHQHQQHAKDSIVLF